MIFRIAIWNPKGGQAKTSLAMAIALEYNYFVQTNDAHSPIDLVLPAGTSYRLPEGGDWFPVPENQRMIFDLGGKSEERVVTAAKASDVVIMPVINNNPLELSVFLEGVFEMLQINPNILIAVCATEKGAFKKTSEQITKHFPSLPIVEIKKSRAFARVIEDRKSISQICKDSGSDAFHFSRVNTQLKNLMFCANNLCAGKAVA